MKLVTARESPAEERAQATVQIDALSVDVEDYYHVEAFADRIEYHNWSGFESRVADNTRRLLDIFAEADAKATFFLLGWVAEREPRLVREILAAGHELGCHSYRHRRVSELSVEAFRTDTRRALDSIQNAAGTEVVGYRAPTFSITHKSLWALEVLAEEGFLYDSSVFPIRHDSYGIPTAPRFSFCWKLSDGKMLYEIPPATIRIMGHNLPATGGGYLRILPVWYTRWAVRRLREGEHQSLVVYCHPWEIDPKQPRLKGGWKSRFRHYRNLDRTENRIRDLLSNRKFVCMHDLLRTQIKRTALTQLSPGELGS